MPKPAKDTRFKRLIEEYADKGGLEKRDLQKNLGICENTLLTRLNTPDTLRIGELRHLMRMLKIPVDRVIDAIRLEG